MRMLCALLATLAAGTAPLAPVKLWADFGSSFYLPNEQAGVRQCREDGDLYCGLTDSDAAFVAKTYSVVSLEKCFGVRASNTNQSNHTETNFAKTAQQIARLAPAGGGDDNDRNNPPPPPPPRVLFYWSSNIAVADCYEDALGGLILQHPEWWLRNTTGGAIWSDPHHVGTRPYIDFSVPAAAAWWVSVPVSVMRRTGSAMGGVFADSAGDWAYHLLASGQITQGKAAAVNAAHKRALGALRAALRAVADEDEDGGRAPLLLGNALGPCSHPPCSANGVQLLREGVVDAVCAEHFGAFEWSNNATSGAVDAAVVNQWLDLFDAAAAVNGSVFVKAWPGPETGPIDGNGPSWPTEFRSPRSGKPLDRSSAGIAEAAADMLDYALACYLCVQRPGFLFSYGWWYDVAQGYLPGADAPAGWYPQLSRPLGKAISAAQISGRHSHSHDHDSGGSGGGAPIMCTRQYEGARVQVDFLDFGSANITWNQ